jgi:photosystem II stability/assembly factor-like uncharacterized protein
MQFLDAQHGWVLYEGSQLHRTTDGGQTWQAVDVRPPVRQGSGSIPAGLRRLVMVSPQVGFGLSSDDIFLRTSDGGLTWRASRIGQDQLPFDQLVFLDPRQGWVADVNGQLYATNDGGQTWRSLPPPPVRSIRLLQFGSATAGWLLDNRAFTLFRTTNGGQSWQACGGGQSVPKIRGFYFRTAATGWAIGVGGVVLRTTDGCVTWQTSQTPSTADLNGIHFVDDMNGWAVGAEDTVLKTTDGGLTWTPVQVNVP